ncbi:uncharacterized protein DUF4902 [Pseudomonas duriflava]|uniref:Uncharacterized protein DUF4902 n=1 Tax=Pseudomonas duriflava TaxID=459528 RepID=A0A562QAB0_9PSED|nr:DUF4902 domain-containing protein [Pseudomonas duriflava]TWI53697.1 uncharacterized protein DUF4902 [Pseudomonas duriflava]
MLALAPDQFIRMSFSEFSQLSFKQHMAWLDDDLQEELRLLGIETLCAGFCEWASTNKASQVSVGWAWFRSQPDQLIYLAPGGVQSNLMLRCTTGYDLGVRCTEELLTSWLAGQDWQRGIPFMH